MTSTPPLAPAHALDPFIGEPHFVERHRRTVGAPVEAVWSAALALTPREVRLLAPFMALRSVPAVLTGGRRTRPGTRETSFLEAFEAEGFVELHRDEQVVDGQALAVFGAAGRFWSPSGGAAVPLADPESFGLHQGPGTAKVAFSLSAQEHAGATLLTTETRVVGRDAAARRAFGAYWMVIRGPSGLIRRSWLAAIDRRARA